RAYLSGPGCAAPGAGRACPLCCRAGCRWPSPRRAYARCGAGGGSAGDTAKTPRATAAGAGGRCAWSTPVPATAGHSCRAFQVIGTGGIADPAPGGQLEFAQGRGGLGTGRLSAGQRHQPAAVLVGQAQRAEGSLAYAGEDPAWRGTAG